MILSVISCINEKILNSNNNRNKPKFLRLLWDIVFYQIDCEFAAYVPFKLTKFTKFYFFKIIDFRILTQL